MRVPARAIRRCRILALSATLLGAVGMAACGGAGDDVAVQVGKTAITKAEVAHWMSVIAGEVSTPSGQPAPEAPDPPRYSACISYRRRYPATFPRGSTSPTPATLQHECEFEFEKEKLKALYSLITSAWVDYEASALGANVSDKELRQQLAEYEKQAPSPAVLRRLLVGTRGTTADLLARIKLIVLTKRVQQKLEREPGKQQLTVAQRQQALDAFGAQFEKRWIARTDCRPSYVVPICKQYKPPKVPSKLVPNAVPLTDMSAE